MAWLTLPMVSHDLHVDIKIEPATNWWKIINFKTTAYYMSIYLSIYLTMYFYIQVILTIYIYQCVCMQYIYIHTLFALQSFVTPSRAPFVLLSACRSTEAKKEGCKLIRSLYDHGQW